MFYLLVIATLAGLFSIFFRSRISEQIRAYFLLILVSIVILKTVDLNIEKSQLTFLSYLLLSFGILSIFSALLSLKKRGNVE